MALVEKEGPTNRRVIETITNSLGFRCLEHGVSCTKI